MTTHKKSLKSFSRDKQSSKRIQCASKRVLWVNFSLILSIILSIPVVEARKIKTKHSIPKVSTSTINKANEGEGILILTTDSMEFDEKIKPAIRFYGFDKTATSNLESFFISNSLDSEISGMEIQITYFDMQGRQLHKRKVCIDCSIPAGETMRTDIKSWDTQKSFYFHKSAKPKRQATPFTVKIELLSITLYT